MRPNRKEIIWRGLIAGVIGYVSIALVVGLSDAIHGRSFFHTVSLLGDWLFFGLYDAERVMIWPAGVIAYNALHFATFIAFGLVSSWLAAMSERGPVYRYAAGALYLVIFAHLLSMVVLMTEPLRTAISLTALALPSLLAAILMSAYLLRAPAKEGGHPGGD